MADTSESESATKTSKTSLLISTFPSNPLTTTFTAPNDCTGVYKSFIWMIDQPTSCLPSTFNPSSTAFYSPGIACPSGYTTACHDTRGVESITTVTCCPFRQGVSLSCISDPLTLSEIWETMFCTWTPAADQIETVDVTLSSNGVTSTTVEVFSGAGGINAYGVRMVHQSSDLTSSTSSGSTTGPTSTAATTTKEPTEPPSNTSTITPTSTPSSSASLSTGAKAATGVVIPVVVLGILAAAFLWWRRRKSQKYNAVEMTGSPRGSHKQGLVHGRDPIYELGTPQSELPGGNVSSELPGHR